MTTPVAAAAPFVLRRCVRSTGTCRNLTAICFLDTSIGGDDVPGVSSKRDADYHDIDMNIDSTLLPAGLAPVPRWRMKSSSKFSARTTAFGAPVVLEGTVVTRWRAASWGWQYLRTRIPEFDGVYRVRNP